MTARPIIAVDDLEVGFPSRGGQTLPILRNVSLEVQPGETIGLVGESGSGKSTLALAMMGYLKTGLRVLQGSVSFRDHRTFALTPRQLERIRGGDLALIPQNAGQALTPSMRVGRQIEEALRLHSSIDPGDRQSRVLELLAQVRLPAPGILARRYPHELSGGQQQRVAIAMALAGEPEALLLDEPTTGLDVTTQAHVLELLRDLARESGTAMVYVSHDLGAIARVCDRVMVMYAGEAVLEGGARGVLLRPRHPYARGLLGSIPRLSEPSLPPAMEGRPPAPGRHGAGCAFAPRCTLADDLCANRRPALIETDDGQWSRCHFIERLTDAAAGMPAGSAPPGAPVVDRDTVLELEDISISYARSGPLDRLLGRDRSSVATVSDISIAVRRGETVGLVGESGSGKSTILRAIAGLMAPERGRISLDGGPSMAPLVQHRGADARRRIQLVFQNPDESLNPRHTIGEILAQPLRLYFDMDGAAIRRRSIELLDKVRLGEHYLERLPGQLSGGEKQRVAIARAFAAEPDVILCDEVTSALDVSVQAAVLKLLGELRRESGVTVVFVSHDLAVVRALSDRVMVLYQGRICETGPTGRVYEQPSHPYTDVLLHAVLEPDPDTAPTLLAADVPETQPPQHGCPFQRRCHRAVAGLCESQAPPARDAGDDHIIRCHLPLEQLG